MLRQQAYSTSDARGGGPERPVNLNPYRKEVGDVPEIGAAINRTAADVHRTADLPDWDLALSLVDRDPQAEALSDCLTGLARNRAARALLVVLPGNNLDCHKYFLARCVAWDLQEQTGKEWINLGTLSWTAGASTSSVLRGIGATLGGPNASDVRSLNEQLGGTGPCICFSHVVDGAHWAFDKGKILADWAKIFTDGRLRLHPARFLIAFLCVQLRVVRTDECRGLERMAEDWRIASRSRNPRIVVMPLLGKVRQTHLESWPTTASRRLKRNLEFQLQVEINSIFEGGQEQYMNDIVKALQEPLRRVFGVGPSVVLRP